MKKPNFLKTQGLVKKLILQKCFGILYYIRNRLDIIIFPKKLKIAALHLTVDSLASEIYPLAV